jgi:ribonucleotide reductase beta subunit family protein with ferritin-like domain
MTLDQNEKKLIEKLVEVLELLDASKKDIQAITGSRKVDANFLKKAAEFFDNTEACNVCSHAFHSWRKTVDDETVLSFIEDWINWKKQNSDPKSPARVIKMKKRS